MKFEINILDIKQNAPIEIIKEKRSLGNIIIQKSYEGPILIIKIQEISTLNKKITKVENTKNIQKFNLNILLSDIGISFINNEIKEFLYLSMKDIVLEFKEEELFQKAKMTIKYIQLDNQLYNALEDVILCPVMHYNNNNKEILPITKLSFSKCKSSKYGLNYFEYFNSLIQEFSLKLDEELLYSLIEFMNFSSLQKKNINNNFNDEQSDISNMIFEDNNKLYFEVFQLQPIKANISFARAEHVDSDVNYSEVLENSTESNINRNNNSNINIFTYLADILTMAIGNIHNAPLVLDALILEHPTVDTNHLFNLIKTHYSQEILGQIHKILGSADLIGNPVNLFNSISSGVYDIFYEPIKGFSGDRPQDIGIGIATVNN